VPRSNQPQASFQSNTPGVFWLQSAGGGTLTSTGMVAVTGTGTPDGYALAPGSRRLVAGECSGAQYVVRSTARGDPAIGADDSAVLESDQLRFFSDFDCRTSMANVDLGANDAISRPFYVMGPLTGLNTLTVRGTLGEASFPFEVLPNRVAKVRVRGPSTLPLSTGCDLLWLESADGRDNLSAEQRAAGAVVVLAQVELQRGYRRFELDAQLLRLGDQIPQQRRLRHAAARSFPCTCGARRRKAAGPRVPPRAGGCMNPCSVSAPRLPASAARWCCAGDLRPRRW
jgi:hypothetical protein